MVIPVGYIGWSMPLRHSGLARTAYITGGSKKETAENDANALAALIQSQFFIADSFVSRMNNEVLVGPLTARVAQDGGEPIVGQAAGGGLGLLALETPPPNVAVLVRKSTNLGGRKNRGRWYIPWYCAESDLNELGVMGSGTVAAIQSAMNVLRGGLNASGVPLVVLHQTSLAVPGIVGSLTTDSLVATQRRRLGR